MSFFTPRVGVPLMAALVLTLLSAHAGELARPVPPDAQVTRLTRFNIRYSLRDIVADGVQKVEFYITDDMGLTWRLYGEDPDRMSPMTVQVPGEGIYGFVCIVTDRYGNREREPVTRTHPETVIVVDHTPPMAKWLAPLQDILGRGQGIEFKWESADPYLGPRPVTLQYAVGARGNHDREANWTDLETRLPANGSFTWTPPAGSTARYNFRLVAEDRAGNMALAYNPATVILDANPPFIMSVSPLRSNKLENNILVDATDGNGGSGVKDISMYMSSNNGGTWVLIKETTDTGESVPVKRSAGTPIAVTAPRPGSYALWPVVFDEAGNATPLPRAGEPGPYILEIDTEAPNVSLSSSFLMGRAAVLANESRRVEWTAYDPNIREYSGVISLSLDNGSTWQEIRSGLPANGSEIINFPFGSHSEDAKLKVSVSDDFGNVGEDVSQSFKLTGAATAIESVTPTTPSSTPSSWGTPFGGDTGTPPAIAVPQGQSPAPSTPYQSYPQAPSWDSPTGPTQGALSAPFGQTPALPPPVPVYSPSSGAITGPGSGESTASSIPNAMLGTVRTQPGQMPTPPPLGPSTTPTPPSTTGSWTPSPGAGRQSPPATLPPVPPVEVIPPTIASPPDTGSAVALPPPAIPTVPATPATAPSSGLAVPPPPSSSPSGKSPFEEFGTSPLMPPPLPGTRDTSSASPSTTDIGSPLPMPSLGAMPAASQAPSLPAPPSATGGSLRPPTAITPPPSMPTPPAIPATPEATSQRIATTTPTAPSMPTMPSLSPGLSLPPDLEPAAPRPVNKRDLSSHYIQESKSFQDEGRWEQALRSATEAVNADDKNPGAFVQLSQIMARSIPPDYVKAATTAKAATELDPNWEVWWNCAEVFYIWAHAQNREIMAAIGSGKTPPESLIDERNRALANAKTAIGNAAVSGQSAGNAARKKIANTQGLIAYLSAMTVPLPTNPGETTGPAADQYRRAMQTYKAAATPLFLEAQPYFQNAMRLDGPPSYSETFHLGMINYRLGNLERDTGNNAQATTYYQEAVKYLQEATTSKEVPNEGPREAYYMLAHCYDLMSRQPGTERTRLMEQARRYWQQTAEFYSPGTPYRAFAEQRIDVLSREMGL